MLQTTTSHSFLAFVISEICPLCNAPIVGTKPIETFPFLNCCKCAVSGFAFLNNIIAGYLTA